MNRPIAEKAVMDTAAQAFHESERARWARAQPRKIVGVWTHKISDEERKQRERDIAASLIPF